MEEGSSSPTAALPFSWGWVPFDRSLMVPGSSLFQGMEIFAFLISGPWHKKVRGIMVWWS